MEKLLHKRYFPKLIIIEGLWGAGKTTFAKFLAKKYSLLFIKEPKHQNLKSEKEISDWYFHQHVKRQMEARENNTKKKVVMERSLISNAAYQYAKMGYLTKQYRNALLRFPELRFAAILFLYANNTTLRQRLSSSEDLSNKRYVTRIFVKRYVEFYRKILPGIIQNQPILLKTVISRKYLPTDKLFLSFRKKYLLLLKDKKIQTLRSGAAIIFYKKDVLLIYDKTWRHYIFPQGQIKINENILSATAREVKEETGFYDIQLLASLPKYQFFYQDYATLTQKVIKVFIYNLRSLNHLRKSLEEHENYQNKFVPIQKAFELLKWPEDRNALKLAIKKTRLYKDRRVY